MSWGVTSALWAWVLGTPMLLATVRTERKGFPGRQGNIGGGQPISLWRPGTARAGERAERRRNWPLQRLFSLVEKFETYTGVKRIQHIIPWSTIERMQYICNIYRHFAILASSVPLLLYFSWCRKENPRLHIISSYMLQTVSLAMSVFLKTWPQCCYIYSPTLIISNIKSMFNFLVLSQKYLL